MTKSCRRPEVSVSGWATSFGLITIVIIIIFIIYSAASTIFHRIGIFTSALPWLTQRHMANDPMAGGWLTAISSIPATVSVIVLWIAPTVAHFPPATTANASQLCGIWIPVKFPSASYGHAPVPFVTLWNDQEEKTVLWWNIQKVNEANY